jgi:hypothetical protein
VRIRASLMVNDAELFGAKRAAHAKLFRIPGVRTVAIGHKFTAGIDTHQVAIVVMVETKRPLSEIPANEVIPAVIDGIPTDVKLWSPEVYCVATLNDDKKYRPLLGGARIAVDLPNFSTSLGTLGFIARTANNGAVVGVTCKHVVSSPAEPWGTSLNGVKVGQSTSSDSSSCCSDIVGTVYRAVEKTPTESVDAAMVVLKKDLTYFRDILSMGAVAGVRPPLGSGDAFTTKVFKRGQRTGTTSGVIGHIETTGAYGPPGAQVILDLGFEINADPATPIWDDCGPEGSCPGLSTTFQAFGCEGDSGAAVYDQQNRLVGLFRSILCDSTCKATPIALVTSQLQIVVETAAAAGQTQTVPGIPGVNMMSGDLDRLTAPAVISPPQVQLIQKVRDELIGIPLGRELDIAIRRHQREVLDLVNGNRRVATIWQRNGGPQIISAVVEMARSSDARLPEVINGEPFENRLNSIAQCLSRYGSEALSTDLARYGPRLALLGGVSYPQLLSRLQQARAE